MELRASGKESLACVNIYETVAVPSCVSGQIAVGAVECCGIGNDTVASVVFARGASAASQMRGLALSGDVSPEGLAVKTSHAVRDPAMCMYPLPYNDYTLSKNLISINVRVEPHLKCSNCLCPAALLDWANPSCELYDLAQHVIFLFYLVQGMCAGWV